MTCRPMNRSFTGLANHDFERGQLVEEVPTYLRVIRVTRHMKWIALCFFFSLSVF